MLNMKTSTVKTTRKTKMNTRRFYQGENISPLYCALEAGHVELANKFLERGADIHARYRFDKTSLQCAAVTGWCDIIRILRLPALF